MYWAEETGQQLETHTAFPEGLIFGLQLPITLVPRNLMTSSGFLGHCMYIWHTNIHMNKNKSLMLGIVTHTLNTTIQETQAGWFCEFQASEGYMVAWRKKTLYISLLFFICACYTVQSSGDKLEESVSSPTMWFLGTELRWVGVSTLIQWAPAGPSPSSEGEKWGGSAEILNGNII